MRIAAALAAIVVLFLFASFAPRQGFSDKSVVQISSESGRGTGVHIGQGKFLTAAHVIGAHKTVTISAGKQDFQATVLWASEKFDLALLESEEANSLASAKLSCREPNVGEAIESVGFPGPFGLAHTYGFVAGTTEAEGTPQVMSNVVLFPGMSGGPVIDRAGHVIAFNNSGRTVQIGPNQHSLTGLSFLVPASSACKLLAMA